MFRLRGGQSALFLLEEEEQGLARTRELVIRPVKLIVDT